MINSACLALVSVEKRARVHYHRADDRLTNCLRKWATARLGETITAPVKIFFVQAASSPEFGKLERVIIWLGDLQARQERALFETRDFADPFSFSQMLPLDLSAGKFYLRGEAHGVGSEFLPERALPCRALTNPIWVELET
jgi:hypothetical protein